MPSIFAQLVRDLASPFIRVGSAMQLDFDAGH